MAEQNNHNDEQVSPELKAIADILAEAIHRKREHDYFESLKSSQNPDESNPKDGKQ